MGAFLGTQVHTADSAVPPLDDELDLALEALTGVHPGLDQIAAGLRLIATERHTTASTELVLSHLGANEDEDARAALRLVIGRMSSADTNPCLRTLPTDDQHLLTAIGAQYATNDLDPDLNPRHLISGACAVLAGDA